MNNFDRGDVLISTAHEYYDELLRAYNRGSWNMVVRRAQEVVELALKGLLKMMGVEYPKSYNVGEVFGRACVDMGLGVESKKLDEIKQISSDLAEKRGPAFYMEEIYDKQHADKAKADAEMVINFSDLLAKKLKTKLQNKE